MESLQIKKDILATLTYFSLFNYPLKKGEIYIFLNTCEDLNDFEESLQSLLDEAVVFKIAGFYSLVDDFYIAARRMKGNEKAAVLLKRAEKSAAIISSFPFIQGVAVSGSLSKNFADENADIDFFIITSANRLWIARTLLHIFKKLTFIFKMEGYFCMNYFIDDADPSIQEKNIYTAIEASTLIPLHGTDIFKRFFEVNSWTKAYLPNKHMATQGKEINNSWMRTLAEKLLDNRLGNRLDNFFMKWTARKWDSKTTNRQKDSKGLVLSMHTGKHFAKPIPDRFQKPLLMKYESKLTEIHRRYELSRFFQPVAQSK